ncbi:MAG: hypothetical protein WEA56_12010 [Balneolaceae bacterium]
MKFVATISKFRSRKYFFSFCVYILLLLFPLFLKAQEVDFSRYGTYTIDLENISMGDLIFDGPVVSGGGIYEVELIDSYIFSIIGVKYLDVGLSITGDGELLLDGNSENSGDPQKSVPFTLKAAYSNRGQNNIADAKIIPVAGGNIGYIRFPVSGREQQPPGPPPPPPTKPFDQAEFEETAFLYLYGEIDVGNVVSGNYTGTITIQIEYE